MSPENKILQVDALDEISLSFLAPADAAKALQQLERLRAELTRASLATNTHLAYLADLRDWILWCKDHDRPYFLLPDP